LKTFEKELQVALVAADLAGKELDRLYAAFQAIPDAPADISTEADRKAQEIILAWLRQEFPGDAFCAEEQTAGLKEGPNVGERLWVVDPIDGTRGFARKNGEFSVMVGFVERGIIGAGVVAEPARRRLTYAVRGGGCWKRDGTTPPVRCSVTPVASLSSATLTQSRSKAGRAQSPIVRALSPARITETYSAGIKLALVARGEADLYVNDYLAFHDWDICAGQILVEEAGGRVTGLKGETLRYGEPGALQERGLLATNGHLHDAALQVMPTA
jgi:3'(2'), 5'-bisphosphate nucleotidase